MEEKYKQESKALTYSSLKGTKSPTISVSIPRYKSSQFIPSNTSFVGCLLDGRMNGSDTSLSLTPFSVAFSDILRSKNKTQNISQKLVFGTFHRDDIWQNIEWSKMPPSERHELPSSQQFRIKRKRRERLRRERVCEPFIEEYALWAKHHRVDS